MKSNCWRSCHVASQMIAHFYVPCRNLGQMDIMLRCQYSLSGLCAVWLLEIRQEWLCHMWCHSACIHRDQRLTAALGSCFYGLMAQLCCCYCRQLQFAMASDMISQLPTAVLHPCMGCRCLCHMPYTGNSKAKAD